MKVIPCGYEVNTKIGKIIAIITGICTRYSRVSYEISYFCNGEHKSCWVTEDEIISRNNHETSIGFQK